MIFDLPFDIVYISENDTAHRLENWEKGVVGGLPYCKTVLDAVEVSVIPCKEAYWYLRVVNTGKDPVSGFWGIRFGWHHAPDCYTMIPALYYNGNVQKHVHTIPMLSPPKTTVFQASFSFAAFPAVLTKEKTRGYSYEISPETAAGWSGVELDAENETLTLFAPARETAPYTFREFSDTPRSPYTLKAGETLSVRFGRQAFCCETVLDIFDHYWEQTVRSPFLKAENTPKISEAEGAACVRDWIYERHCFFNNRKEPMLLNAFEDLEIQPPHINRYAEWNIMIGWCSGTMTALPLLRYGGKYRTFAVKLLDFLAVSGDAPSGVKYPIYDGERWMTKTHPQYDQRYSHLRFYCDYLCYLGKAIRLEKAAQHSHPTWETAFSRGMEILTQLWQKERDFGLYWDVDTSPVTITRKGSAAGAFALLSLAEGVLHAPSNEQLKKVFREACEVYYERCVATGRCNGGPVDIQEADDSESIAALADALVQNHKLFGGEKALRMALDAAKLFSTWVINYTPQMAKGSLFESINISGGVIANIQNRHVGPGICTNSARFLYDLGCATQDTRWHELYDRIKTAALNCMTTYDGEFYGLSPDKPFYKGMLTEQINLGGGLGAAGETWRVSASWPATAILLGWMDAPMAMRKAERKEAKKEI